MTNDPEWVHFSSGGSALDSLREAGIAVSPEAQRAIRRTEFIGFGWYLSHSPSNEKFVAYIRVPNARLMMVVKVASEASAAICAAYDELVAYLPGIVHCGSFPDCKGDLEKQARTETIASWIVENVDASVVSFDEGDDLGLVYNLLHLLTEGKGFKRYEYEPEQIAEVESLWKAASRWLR